MKAWFAWDELVGLPSLPTTKRSINRVAQRDDWICRARHSRGGGREFHIDSLPDAARKALAARALTERPPGGREPGPVRDPAAAPPPAAGKASPGLDPALAISALRDGKVAGVAEARLEILDLFDTYLSDCGAPVVDASLAFAVLYNNDQVDATDAARRLVPSLSGPTLRRWRRARGKAGLTGLTNKYGRHRKGKGKIESDQDVRDLIVGIIAHQPHANAKQVMRGLRQRFKETPARIPGYRTVQRFITNWKVANESAFLMHRDPDAWKSRRRAAFGSASMRAERLNQVWELDSTSAEVMLQDGRYTIVACVDVFSRRALVFVSRTSRASAIISLMRRACLEWGVPESVKTDNGKDYVSAHMTRALRALGIDHEVCPPFTPEAKPHVERFIGTITHDLFEQLPGYIGHNVAQRKEIESRRSFAERFGNGDSLLGAVPLTAAELQAACDAWSENIYGRERHGGIGKSPFQAATDWAGPIARVEDERALDVLLAEAPGTHGVRTVGKKGIAVEGTHFIAPELGAWEGRRVHVRLDAADMGRIYVFGSENSEFICVAEAPERTGANREEIAARAREIQRTIVRDGVKEIRLTARKVKAHNIINEVLDGARADAGRVAAFPRPSELHDTPEMKEAARAIAPKKAAELSAEDEAAADALWEKYEGEERPVAEVLQFAPTGGTVRPDFPDDESFARWVMGHPDEATAADTSRLKELLKSRSFRLLLDVDEDGEKAARA